MNTTDPRYEQTDTQAARLALTAFIVIGAFIGYEWFMSGLTKIVRGGFPSGLADELHEKSEGTVGWYKSFLDGTVIPNGKAFGIIVEVGELAIGLGLIAAAIVLLTRWRDLSYRWQMGVLVTIALASLGAILMNVNFHLANGSPHPWLIPKDGFDEGVDLDSLMPLIQLAILIVSAKLVVILRRAHRAAERLEAGRPHTPPTRPASVVG